MLQINKRESNIELFRIFLMLMIISHHYVVNSELTELFDTHEVTLNMAFLWLFGWGGKVGINCFILITGYFMCKQSFTWRKFFKLFLEVEFYSVFIYLVFVISGYVHFSIIDLGISILFVVRDIGHGFVGSFVALYLLIPAVNMLVKSMSKVQFSKLLIALLAVYTIIPTFLVTHHFEYIGWYITVYLIGSYYRLFPPTWTTNINKIILYNVFCFFAIIASMVIMIFFDIYKGRFKHGSI